MNEMARLHAVASDDISTREHFVQPWLLGYRPQVFSTYWQFMDIDLDRRKRAG
jgi:hypothetical protein